MTVILRGKMVRFSEREISGRSIKNISIAQSDDMGLDVTKLTLYGDDAIKDTHLGLVVELELLMSSYDGTTYRVSEIKYIESFLDANTADSNAEPHNWYPQ